MLTFKILIVYIKIINKKIKFNWDQIYKKK